MKLVRWGLSGAEKPGVVDPSGVVRDLSAEVDDIDASVLSDESLQAIAGLNIAALPSVPHGTRLGPCVARVGKLICIGLNYRDHAREANLAEPAEPIIFFKATSAITGPTDPIEIPPGANKVDWEIELGVVIGKPGRRIAVSDARSHVAGYCIVNDVSERAWQMERGGQWDKGKSADTFAPLGPWLVTRDEIPDPQRLSLLLEVDGACRQQGTTSDMIFGVSELVAYVSQFMSLQPGDVIATGTPAGVGMGFKPAIFLRPGQALRLSVEGLGKQISPVVAAA